MKTLYMIRHSLTEGNERRLYYGRTDLPLSESGRALCEGLRGRFALPENVRFAASGMLRAEETLRLLFGDVPFQTLPELREMDMGEFEMKSYDQLKDNPAYQAWLSDASGETVIPGGESNRRFFDRTLACARALSTSPDEHLFIVCHGGVIASIMLGFFPTERESFYDWIPHACRGYAVSFENGQAAGWQEI